jgi:5-methylcytosine-specific restriction enzyme B
MRPSVAGARRSTRMGWSTRLRATRAAHGSRHRGEQSSGADRSIRSIDLALRRRFDVFELPPDPEVLERYFETRDCFVENLVDGFKQLNVDLQSRLDRHHRIGHAFFMRDGLDRKALAALWHRKIFPLIEEYFFDQPDVAAQFTLEKYWPLPAQ